MSLNHLFDHVAEIALKSNDERIYHTKSRFWIPYKRATEILKVFNDALKHPKDDRMPSYLLVGNSNNGKTHILREFEKIFPVRHVNGVGTKLDVLYAQTPEKAEESRFYNEILSRLNVAFNLSDRVPKKKFQVREILQALELKILILDELHNIISSTASQQGNFLTLLKALSNDLRIVIICAGTEAAQRVINSDKQLANRFEPLPLKNWKLDTDPQKKEYLELLLTFEKLLPLKKESKIYSGKLPLKIYDMGEGLIGEFSKILKLATVYAIESGEEIIYSETLDKIRFIPPSLRPKTRIGDKD